MLLTVTECRRAGTLIDRDELRAIEPQLGWLTISDWIEGHAENRALRVANLRHPTTDYHPTLLLPLFDPEVVRCDPRGMVLRGWQIVAGTKSQVIQEWWLRPPPANR